MIQSREFSQISHGTSQRSPETTRLQSQNQRSDHTADRKGGGEAGDKVSTRFRYIKWLSMFHFLHSLMIVNCDHLLLDCLQSISFQWVAI